MLGELGAVIFGSVLRTAVGVMDAPRWRSARRGGGSKGRKRQTCIDPLTDRIADNSPRPSVQDRSESIYKKAIAGFGIPLEDARVKPSAAFRLEPDGAWH